MKEAYARYKIEGKLINIRLQVHKDLPQWAIILIDKYPINEFLLEIDEDYEPLWKNVDFNSAYYSSDNKNSHILRYIG